MIQANELRIGNKILYTHPEYESLINTVTVEDIEQCLIDNCGFNKIHAPILLTEEILLKCGFVKLKPYFSLSVGGESLIYYLHEESGFLIWYHGEKLGYSLQQVIRNSINPECTCFNTVHELQNIFYWNKKKQELEIIL